MTHQRICWWPAFRHDLYFLFESPMFWEIDDALIITGIQVTV